MRRNRKRSWWILQLYKRGGRSAAHHDRGSRIRNVPILRRVRNRLVPRIPILINRRHKIQITDTPKHTAGDRKSPVFLCIRPGAVKRNVGSYIVQEFKYDIIRITIKYIRVLTDLTQFLNVVSRIGLLWIQTVHLP